ncbi:MAG: hypothetical protein GFH27_549431n41 [Chloroflexi bacterium AL-W]|nr:hypothetical protein [Chloroflexi bacterium AL-N1]NOK71645.1 hypothetical protein [Chloroflexi bacterium AL-N10]NOK78945.1 hypothetical protein [Chloroflexi bacterium AL-N5]NOK86420.1 hypothetical protein [Chloroflexi bacterium AL-W]
MTSHKEQMVVDLQTARQRLEEFEQDREDSVYWDNGYWWEKAFNELITYEQEYVQRLIQSIDAISSYDDNATLYSQKLNRVLIRSIEWHTAFRQSLDQTLAHWNATETISHSTCQLLITHIAYINEHILFQGIRLKQVRLEQLERRRRQTGNIDLSSWRLIWDELQIVLNEQNQFYTEVYEITLPEHLTIKHLVWLERMYAIQRETLQLWDGQPNVNAKQLQHDIHMVERSIKELQPKEHHSWLSRLVAGLIGMMLFIFTLYSLWGSISASSSPLQDQIAVPIATALSNDSQLLNEQGILFLQEGRCDTAIQYFEAAITVKPEWYEPFNNKAFCLYDQGHVTEATEAWRIAVALAPQSPDANAGLGMALYSIGEAHEATQHYSVAIGLRPEYVNEEWLRNEAWWSEQAIEASRPLRVTLGE